MNYFEILTIALQILFARSGTFYAYINGSRRQITVTEVSTSQPLGRVNFEQALLMATQIFAGEASFEVRVGADVYQVTETAA